MRWAYCLRSTSKHSLLLFDAARAKSSQKASRKQTKDTLREAIQQRSAKDEVRRKDERKAEAILVVDVLDASKSEEVSEV